MSEKLNLSMAPKETDSTDGFEQSMETARVGQWNPSTREAPRKKKNAQIISLSSLALKPKRSVKNSSYELRYFFLIVILIMIFMLIHHMMQGDLGAYFAYIEKILFGWM